MIKFVIKKNLFCFQFRALSGADVAFNFFFSAYHKIGASLLAQWVKGLPAMLETQVQSLGQEVPLEKEMAACSSTLAWKIPCTEEPGELQSMGLQRVTQD